MSWCPNCKSEYREGVTVCADCCVDLVSELPEESPMIELIVTENKELAEKFKDFLVYSNIETAELGYDEERELYIVLVDKESVKEAKRLYRGFYLEEKEKERDAREDDPKPIVNTTYVKKEDQYKDLQSTAFTFLTFGILGILFDILNIMGIIHFFSGPIAFTVTLGMFIGFLIIGITTIKKAHKAKEQISGENQTVIATNEWLKTNVTESFLSELQDDSLSDEINYFNKTEKIKEMLLDEFKELDESFVDHQVDEFYNNNF